MSYNRVTWPNWLSLISMVSIVAPTATKNKDEIKGWGQIWAVRNHVASFSSLKWTHQSSLMSLDRMVMPPNVWWRQFSEVIFEAFSGATRFQEETHSFKIEVNFLISQLPLLVLFWIFVDLSDPNCFCVPEFWHHRVSRPSIAATPFLNINLRFLNDCQVLSTQMFSSATTYLRRNFQRRLNFALQLLHLREREHAYARVSVCDLFRHLYVSAV